MLIYSNNRKSKYYEVPIWKADRFMRLRGFVDSLTHKTDFRTKGEKNTSAVNSRRWKLRRWHG